MLETNNKFWQKDIESIANEKIIDSFKNASILITGATGLIGKELVLSFLCANRIKNLNIKIIALVRNIEKAKKIFKNIINDKNFEIINQDITTPIDYNKKLDYIIHCANTTSSKEIIEKPVTTIETIYSGTKNILELAKKNKIKSLIYISSLEIYGIIQKNKMINENDFGYIDLSNPRSSYPEAKRIAENLCCSYAHEYNLDIKIARLTQTFGAGISPEDNRVFAQFAKNAVAKKDIILHTKGETIRNYCYLTDAILAILYILILGKKAENYNVANKNTKISIADMAKLIAKMCSTKIEFEINNNNYGYNPTIKACLNPKKLESLGWKPKINLNEMFTRLINYLKEE